MMGSIHYYVRSVSINNNILLFYSPFNHFIIMFHILKRSSWPSMSVASDCKHCLSLYIFFIYIKNNSCLLMNYNSMKVKIIY